ncbi:MAG TPA: VOC family protein [Nitrososphaeraceae archaeon]|jgi:hypothetical protein
MPTIVHFEIPSDDLERSKAFYKELFGWNIEKWPGNETGDGSQRMEYLLITTTDSNGYKALSGGMMKRQNPQQQGMANYIDVTSVDEYSAKIEKLGGKVVMQKTPVPGMGYFSVCLDTEGNRFGIWETDSTAKG